MIVDDVLTMDGLKRICGNDLDEFAERGMLSIELLRILMETRDNKK